MSISKSTIVSFLGLVAILIGIPLVIITHEAGRTGQSLGEYLKRAVAKMSAGSSESRAKPSDIPVPGEKIEFL